MGKHGNQDNGKQDSGGTPGYEPKHAGRQDGYEWAENWQSAPGNPPADRPTSHRKGK